MPADTTSFAITRGTDWVVGLSLQDCPCGGYLDLTEWTFEAVLTSSTGVELATPTIELRTPEANCIRISLDPTQTAALAAQFGAHLAISGTRPDSIKLPLVSARVTITNL